MARELCALNRERQAVEQTIHAQAVEQIDHLPPQERGALVLASDTWHQGVVGIVASPPVGKIRLSQLYDPLKRHRGQGLSAAVGAASTFRRLERRPTSCWISAVTSWRRASPSMSPIFPPSASG